jgi:hypothetical protein
MPLLYCLYYKGYFLSAGLTWNTTASLHARRIDTDKIPLQV